MYPIGTPIAYSNVVADEELLRIAQERIDSVRRMTDALFMYLTFDQRLMIMTKDAPVARVPFYTDGMLVRAVQARDLTQKQINMIQNAMADMPDSQAAIVEGSILIPLRTQLENNELWISTMQAELEKDATNDPA